MELKTRRPSIFSNAFIVKQLFKCCLVDYERCLYYWTRTLIRSLLLLTDTNQLTFVLAFVLTWFNTITEQSYTHMHTLLFLHVDAAQAEQPESPRAINISLRASKCIKWRLWVCTFVCLSIFEMWIWFCTSTNTAKLPFALLHCVVCYPERLIVRLKGAFKGWSI